jgi:hypothetical protein
LYDMVSVELVELCDRLLERCRSVKMMLNHKTGKDPDPGKEIKA